MCAGAHGGPEASCFLELGDRQLQVSDMGVGN